jgi:hypothetical protein
MLLEPGPIAVLDPAREIPRPLAFGFEALAANTHAQSEAVRARLEADQSRMASDLGGSPIGELEAPLARAIGAHAGHVAGEILSLAGELALAHALDDEAAFVQSGFPAENERPSLPPIGSAGTIEIPPLPGGGAPGGGGDTGGAPGGGGDTGGAPGGGGGGDEYEGRGDPRIDEAYRILKAIGDQEGASVERSDPRLLVEKADGIDRYSGNLELAAEAEFRPQYHRRGGG